ncbi:Uncharacterised protein [Escherichia coli]|uniref:Uncharacterized protein n=1 Tax=Escherichia coli TaxID=562 RepID=A0A377DTA6_ECOLX|nr:Uncharacterised protein [Escherichia coli]
MPYKTKSDLPESVKHVFYRLMPRISIKKRSTAHGINIKIKKIGVMTPVAKKPRIKWPGLL